VFEGTQHNLYDGEEMTDENLVYAHSGCCGAHWELVYDLDAKRYDLRCENCGEPVQSEIVVSGPDLPDDNCICDGCKRKRAESN
jgi:hypothetical protein